MTCIELANSLAVAFDTNAVSPRSRAHATALSTLISQDSQTATISSTLQSRTVTPLRDNTLAAASLRKANTALRSRTQATRATVGLIASGDYLGGGEGKSRKRVCGSWVSFINTLFLSVVIPNRFIGEGSAFCAKTADSSRDTAALRGNDSTCTTTSVRRVVLVALSAVLHHWRDDGAVSPNTIVRYMRSTICFCAGVSGPFSSSPMALSELW